MSVDKRQVHWRKSSRSANTGNCVEIAELPSGTRFVRDTKDREAGMLSINRGAWGAFTNMVKSGRLDG